MDYEFFNEANRYDLVIVVAGVTVPGKYLGGKPITINELSEWFRIISKPLKVLVGPAAKFGIGIEGGRVAELPTKIKENFDLLVKGDPEVVIHEVIREDSLEKADPYATRRSYKEIEDFKVAIGNLYGNYFYILLLPYPYSFDLLEVYLRGFWYREKEPNVNEDYELLGEFNGE